MLKQNLSFKLQQKLSPQQIQLMKMLQLPTVEMEERIKQEIEENPALEEGEEGDSETDVETELNTEAEADANDADNDRDEIDLNDYYDDDTPDYKLQVNNKGRDDEERETPLAGGNTFQDNLRSQLSLRNINERIEELGIQLIGNLDEDGYLRRELDSIVNDLAFTANIMTTREELEVALKEVQGLDPAGVGARDLRECLLLQLDRLPHSVETLTARAMIDKHFEAFTKKHYDKVMERLEIDEEALRSGIEVIMHLNPKPGNTERSSDKPIRRSSRTSW